MQSTTTIYVLEQETETLSEDIDLSKVHSLSDSNVLACGESSRCSQRGDDGREGQNGEKRGAEDQQETQRGAAGNSTLDSRKPSIVGYLGGEAGRPVGPVLIPGVVLTHVLAELESMAFEERRHPPSRLAHLGGSW